MSGLFFQARLRLALFMSLEEHQKAVTGQTGGMRILVEEFLLRAAGR